MKKSMKIAFVVHQFPALSETFILDQITGLLDLGHDVEVLVNGPNYNANRVRTDVKKLDLVDKVHYIPRSRIERLLRATYLIVTNFHKSPLKLLRSLNVFKYGRYALSLRLLYLIIPFLHNDFDIIQCHFGPNGNMVACLKRIGIKGKLVTMFHGYDIRRGIKKGASIYCQLFKFGDCFLANSAYTYQNVVDLGADPEKTIIHNPGVDVSKFPYRWESAAVLERPSPVIILTVARLVEEKGLEYGIKAIRKLLKDDPNLCIEYHIIGKGQLEDELREFVQRHNLDRVVRFLGPMGREDVIRKLQHAHIFLLPSVAEALGVVLMEAQAVCLPVVATTVGGVPEVVINDKSGFLVPERDIDALAEKLDYLIEHPETWREMGECGRKFIAQKYDIRNLNQQLVQIYESLFTDNVKTCRRKNLVGVLNE